MFGEPEIPLQVRVHYLLPRYYGRRIRLFFSTGTLLALALPSLIPGASLLVSYVFASVLVIGVIAGWMQLRHRWVYIINTTISLIAAIGFEYYAVYAFTVGTPGTGTVYQITAFVFLGVIYSSAKVFRGIYWDRYWPKNWSAW